MANRVTMTEGPLLGVLLRVTWPIAAAGLVQALHQLVNAFWVGRLGADAIAAVSASGSLFFVLISFGTGLSTAGGVLVAQYTGAGKSHMTDHVAAQTLLMVVAVGLGFSAIGFACARPVLRLIGVDAQVYDLTWQYLTISYLGLVPMFAFMSLQRMLQSAGEVRYAMIMMIAAVLFNAALDPLLIFGTAPVGGAWRGLGVAGAAHGAIDLVVIGLLVSVPIVVFGSTVVLKLVERFPVIIQGGAAVLAFTAAKMIVGEPLLDAVFDPHAAARFATYALAIAGVLAAGRWAARRDARMQA